jgi:arylsulfatase A
MSSLAISRAFLAVIVAALDRARVAPETIVLFSSDNGFAHYVGAAELEARGHYPSGPFRGYQSDAWEAGHRVPFIVRWPGVAKRGSVCDQLVHQADLMTTLAEVLGAKLPDDVSEDSVSLLPLLRGGDDGQTVRLYDLAADIGETNNLAAREPQHVARMQELLEKLIVDGRSTLGIAQRNDVEVIRCPAAKKATGQRARD